MKKVLIIVVSITISLGLIYFITTHIKIEDKSHKPNNLKEQNQVTDIANTIDKPIEEQKYYLHRSNIQVPSQEKCYTAQEKALSNLSEEEKKSIQKEIRENHIYMEYQLLDAVRLVKDKNSPYWESFTSYEVFTEPSGIKVDYGGRFLFILDNIKKVKEKIKNEETKIEIQKFCDTLEEGMLDHNIQKCFEAHEILHDYDYWIINTPVHLDYDPADWGGVTTYFGKATI